MIATLVLLSALTLVPPTTLAQPECALAKLAGPGEPARWLESCGRVDPRGNPEEVARRALAQHARKLDLSADGDLALLAVQQTSAATHVRFSQLHKGVPVYLGQVLVQYDASGEVQLINNHTLPDLDLDVTPVVDAGAAQALALAQVAGSDRLRAPIEQELVIYGEGKEPRLAWHVVLYTQQPPGDWHVMVAADTGAVLDVWDEIWGASGSGLGFAANAVQGSGDTTLSDNNDATSPALDSARVTLALYNLSDATNQLKGSHVDMTAPGVQGCNQAYTPGQADEPSRVYNYTRDDDRFEEVNAYAAIDGAQSWFQSLGFTNVNNRAIPVDVHCISVDNSFYSGSDGALHFGDGGVDDAEDGDIVLHEYGHAVQDNQVPGWGPGGDTEQAAMGEGFGDFLAGMYFINTGAPAYLDSYKYCIGEWDAAAYNPVVAGNAGSGCLRWIDGRDEITGGPIGAYSGTPTQVHEDGRYWSAALTCIYEGMGADAAARDDVMRLVLQHHFSLTPDSSDQAFEQAVLALRLADLSLFGGANLELIAQCATERNLITTFPLLPPTITAPAENAEIETGTAVTISWNGNDSPPNATYEIEYALCEQMPPPNDIVWTSLAITGRGASSYTWTTPATPGDYCLRIREQASGFTPSDYSRIRAITLVPPNTPPTISSIADQGMYEGDELPALSFTIGDGETAPASLTLTAGSSNQTLLPNVGIVLGGSGAERTVALTPASGQVGTATVTLTVSDGKASVSTSFVLTVTPQPVAPGTQLYLPLLRAN